MNATAKQFTEFQVQYSSMMERMFEVMKQALANGMTAEEMMDDPVVMAKSQVRECGDCTFCCIAPAISEPATEGAFPYKPSGKKCVGCSATGCTIYDKRPSVCRGYLCTYAVGIGDRRPNKTGVAWSLIPEFGETVSVMAMGHCMDISEVLDEHENRRMISYLLRVRQLSRVMLRAPNEVVLFLPNGMALKARRIDRESEMTGRTATEEFIQTDEYENPLPWIIAQEEGITGMMPRR